MRRLARRLFTLCSAVSLVLCVVVCVFWVRSRRAEDYVQRISVGPKGGHVVKLSSTLGRIEVFFMATSDGFFRNKKVGVSAETGGEPEPLDAEGTVWGFRFRRYDYGPMRYARGSVPHALVMLAAAAPPTFRMWARRRRRRGHQGRCPACGYDLRATPGHCPECGAAPAATTGVVGGRS